MKVTSLNIIEGTAREVRCPRGGFISSRLLIAEDRMGFSFHHTFIPMGEPQHWHYKRHLEACYCVSGRGTLRNRQTGDLFRIIPGTLYALDQHDDHEFQAHEDTVLICVFNPPLHGAEVHLADGSYAEAT